MNVVIVESPAKAKTINKYLGSDYTVLASYGHVRDLPSRNGSVRPEDDFAMEWEMDPGSKKRIQEITVAVKKADCLYLATDPDREGEAIAWHVREVLEAKKLLGSVDVKRVSFNEITKKAVLHAFDNPRQLDNGLIDAYLARRTLDYLVGFTLSPVLWRKLPGSRSAGRVQSVALRLICERETEIEAFKADEYWTVKAEFNTAEGNAFSAALTHLDGARLGKMTIDNEVEANNALKAVEAGNFAVAKVERKQTRRHPSPPFTTSTLQQEASSKLHFGAKRTMMVAQKLYEGVNIGGDSVGLITYMRTDGVQIAGEAVAQVRRLIGSDYGDSYIPEKPRAYKARAKNAQEAHEAIRPTDISRRPNDISGYLDKDQARLYTLIWNRAVASQMASAVIDQVAADLACGTDDAVTMRATGSVIAFDGFLKLYRIETDNGDDKDREKILPRLSEGDKVKTIKVDAEQHFTQPPPRYSEASLVKRLEELGIGRPSTYASIISVLQDRDYVRIEARRFLPEDRGRLVTAFLSSFFTRYVEYEFTAELEEKLDDISGGRMAWKVLLKDFWSAFSKTVGATDDLRVRDVLDALNQLLAPHFFPDDGSGKDPMACPVCDDGKSSIKLGKFGAFIGCSNYPECKYTRPLMAANGDGQTAADNGPTILGNDPDSGLEVSLRAGPYGHYVQLGEAGEEKGKKTKPKRASLAKGMAPSEIDISKALSLLALPRDVGIHPETGDIIVAGLGRYGPYLNYSGVYLSLKGDDDVLSIGLNRAVTLIAEAPKKDPPRQLGNHPKGGKPVTVRSGRWGPYTQHGSVRANLPKGVDSEKITLEEAIKLLDAKGKKGKSAKKKTTRKKSAKKK